MSAGTPTLFDPALIAQRRDRALCLGFDKGADFLHRAAGASLLDRLGDVPRDFPRLCLAGAATGAVPEMLAERAGADETLLIERSPAMAARSGAVLLEGETLPVPQGRFDLAVSSMLLHQVNDPVGHLIQMRRALKPDGLFLAALPGGQTLHELRAALAEAEAEVTGGLSPRVSPMGEIRDLGGLLQRAGFTMPVADCERLTVTYRSPLHLMRDLRAMGETNALAARMRAPMRRALLNRACEIYERSFPADGGGIRATFEMVFLTGWSPGPDQPEPLRPGSAKTRLADALGTFEIPAGDKPPGKS
ncbi:methyltransferase domain-containing protein [Rhodobacteraceae bacterium NNCM2]|nr:methyltransferase domain-containing protein [Coraliihabitans acroporae]